LIAKIDLHKILVRRIIDADNPLLRGNFGFCFSQNWNPLFPEREVERI
jgi:hypothetical protein